MGEFIEKNLRGTPGLSPAHRIRCLHTLSCSVCFVILKIQYITYCLPARMNRK